MAKVYYPPPTIPQTSPSVLVQTTSSDIVPIYIRDPVPLPVKTPPIRERDRQSHIDGQLHEPSESAEADPLVDERGPWDRKNLLTLDGGGVRGFYQLLLLQKLMADIAKLEQELNDESKSSSYSPLFRSIPSNDDTGYLPCHYFDYIAGTSTGGLIAIMLGRWRMSVDQSIKAYTVLSEKIFRNPSNPLIRLSLSKRSPKQRKLKEKFDSWSDNEGGRRFFSETRDQCQTIVCALKKSTDDALAPFLFRSYEVNAAFPSRRVDSDGSSVSGQHELGQSKPKDVQTSTAAQAATAPSFFKPIKYHVDGDIYHDAVWSFNNPSWVIYKEIVEEERQELECLVSIGCGRNRSKQPTSPLRSVFDRIRDSSAVERDLQHEAEIQGFRYYRLDVENEERKVMLDEWKPKSSGKSTMEKIRSAADKYLAQVQIAEHCRAIAQLLVQRRRRRARTLRWEVFASATWYVCPEENCPDKNARFDHRNALLDHLRAVHDAPPPDAGHYELIQNRLDEGRKKGRHL